jgi:hypothetical protein
MRERQPLFGSFLIAIVGSAFLVNFLLAAEGKSRWLIAGYGIGNALCFMHTARSIYRDRVA